MKVHRVNCIREILSTEITYVHNIRALVEVYYRPLQKIAKRGDSSDSGNSASPTTDSSANSSIQITEKELSRIFSDVEVIVQVNTIFLDKLQERIAAADREGSIQTCCLGDIFSFIAPFFKTYTRYCNNYDHALQTLNAKRADPEFKELIHVMDRDDRTSRLGLTSYLIMPIQRIPRYRLLLQDLMRHTPNEHPDYSSLKAALEQIEQVALHLNVSMKSAEEASKILEIQDRIEFPPSSKLGNINLLLEPHRRLIREGDLQMLVPSIMGVEDSGSDMVSMNIHTILFNDIMLVCHKKSASYFGGKSTLSFALRLELNWISSIEYFEEEFKILIKMSLDFGELFSRNYCAEDFFPGKLLSEASFYTTHEKNKKKVNYFYLDFSKNANLKPDDILGWMRDFEAARARASELNSKNYSGTQKNVHDKNDQQDDDEDTNITTLKSAIISQGANTKDQFENVLECVMWMKKGATMLKYCRNVKPHFRRFFLSMDEARLYWGSPKKKSTDSCVLIRDIRKLAKGQQSGIFQRYRNPDLEHLSFSIFYHPNQPQSDSTYVDDAEARTLDIVCKDLKEFTIWVEGLRLLASSSSSLPRHPPNNVYVTQEMFMQFFQKLDGSAGAGSDSGMSGLGAAGYDPNSDEMGGGSVATGTIANILLRRHERKNFQEAFQKIGDAYMWGQSQRGALGHGADLPEDQKTPLVMKDFLYLDVIEIDCEAASGAAITSGGELFTWGVGDDYKLGHGDKTDRFRPSLVKSLKGEKITAVSVGAKHMMVLDDKKRVFTWGGNEFGQLGHGEFAGTKEHPTVIEHFRSLFEQDDGKEVVHIDCGSWHNGAVTKDGQLYTWGRGEDGQLGHGQPPPESGDAAANLAVPTLVSALQEFEVIEVALGLWHGLALLSTGQVVSWGNNTYGQLGHGDRVTLWQPKIIEAFSNDKIEMVAAGSSHSAAVNSKGEVYVWGNGIYGQIGHGKRENCNDRPVLIDTLLSEKIIIVACGANHTMVLTDSGKVFAWGAGTYGRLGVGNEQDQNSPALVSYFTEKAVRSIAAGGAQSACICAHMWVPDKDAIQCMSCKKPFTFTRRRHHCRNCGGIFCHNCCSKRLPLLRFGFDEPVRVCNNCHQILQLYRSGVAGSSTPGSK